MNYITRELLPSLFLFTMAYTFCFLQILISLVIWGLAKKIVCAVHTSSLYIMARGIVLASPNANLSYRRTGLPELKGSING